jgi:Lon-like protease
MITRRTLASLLAFALVIGLAVVVARQPVPYVTYSPGPTVDVLGEFDGEEIIEVSRRTYDDDGALRLTTVVPSGPDRKVHLPELLNAWVDPDRAVYPRSAIYAPEDTRESVRTESGIQMASSQDNAVAAALTALDIDFDEAVKVALVEEDGPSDGKLEAGDLILAVDGKQVSTLEQLTSAIQPKPVGSTVRLRVRRDGEVLTRRIRTVESPQDETKSAVLIQIAPSYEFPFEVDLNISENIGGPSAGLMFALGIYDVLTPGSLTGGKVIAGTGEIDPQGRVGPIGGIAQKVAGAQDDDAELFLVPAANCAEALDAGHDPDEIRLVRTTSFEQAVDSLETWVENPDADLPRCTR